MQWGAFLSVFASHIPGFLVLARDGPGRRHVTRDLLLRWDMIFHRGLEPDPDDPYIRNRINTRTFKRPQVERVCIHTKLRLVNLTK